MCGIAGIVGPGSEFQGNVLSLMSSRIAHRGPDDDGVWMGSSAALAHRRLSIIDLTHDGHQPMLSDCGRYALVFNGEIYNYLELREELVAKGDRFKGGSDSEVLLAALRRWGADALPRLNGMWAFGFWDIETRTLLAARDRFGKKPFYYVDLGGRLYFASEIKALLAIPGFKTVPDPAAIGDFSAERISDHGAKTFFEDVKQILPAHMLEWKAGRIDHRQYWRLEAASRGSYRPAAVSEIRMLLNDAIALRLRADTPVGCMLSGGLDSSSIACIAQEIATSDRQRHVFSTVHATSYDEAAGIDAVRSRFPHAQFHSDQPTADSFWQDFDQVLWHQEQPFADASMVAHYGLMRLAKSRGVPVLLSGQAADELFVGYPDHAWAYAGSRVRTGEFGALATFLKATYGRGPLPLRKLTFNALPGWLAAYVRKVSRQGRLGWLAEPYRHVTQDAVRPGRSGVDPLHATLLHAIDVATLPGFLHYEDRNSMAFGVETRLPFLDYRLAELMFQIAPADNLTEAKTKALLRNAVSDSVPASICNRLDKTGYPAPLHLWLRARPDELRDAARARACPLIDYPAWNRSVDAFLSGADECLEATWRGFVLMRWYKLFFGTGQAA